MGSIEVWVGMVVWVSLTVYVLSGGADFGGGIWDLLARGPRAKAQREAIAHAIGPIWEANHVWLILAVVLMFVCFPKGFAVLSIALHIPLSIMLIGIVLRGSAFVFRAYDRKTDEVQRRWSRVFAIASVVAPFMLGVCVGAVVSGRIRINPTTGGLSSGFLEAWLAPFPMAVGLLTLALCALLAAVYLTVEVTELELREDFRRRALGAGVATGLVAWATLSLAKRGAPQVWESLSSSPWAFTFQAVTALSALGTMGALWRRRFQLARVLVILQVVLILAGWALSHGALSLDPYLVVPDLTFKEAAAPESVLRAVLITLGIGSLLLGPAFLFLYSVFKRADVEPGSASHG